MLNKDFVLKGPPDDWIDSKICPMLLLGKCMVDYQKKRNPGDMLCIDGVTNDILTSGQFVSETLKVAHTLRELGVKIGDVVAIVSGNSVKYIVLEAAILYIGAVCNPLNPGYSIGELKHAFNMSKPKVVFCSKFALNNIKSLQDELEFIHTIILVDSGNHNVNGISTLGALLELTTIDVANVEPADFDPYKHTAMIFLSSGTTGLPKGVMLTHENFRHPMNYLWHPDYIPTGEADVTLAVLPFFHILGAAPLLVGALHSSKLVCLPAFQPEIFLKSIQEYKVTMLYTVPPIVGFLTKHPLVQKFDISSVRMALCSGGALGREMQDAFTKVHPTIKIVTMYGITETTGACTIVTSSHRNKAGTVGAVCPGIEAMIWSSDASVNLGANKVGELCFKGPTIMKGYIGGELNDVDRNGFYHTGDTGYYDEDGDFYIIGRIKELIKYKGFQVAPAELEDLLLKHPAVKDCGVIGIPDTRAGQLPTALVVRQNDTNITEEEIISYVSERISVQKQLHGGVKFIDAVPRNAAGKILRLKLIEMYNTL